MIRTTLATSVMVYGEDGLMPASELRDTALEVMESDLSGGAILWMGRESESPQIRIALTGAERIALIEALGGTR